MCLPLSLSLSVHPKYNDFHKLNPYHFIAFILTSSDLEQHCFKTFLAQTNNEIWKAYDYINSDIRMYWFPPGVVEVALYVGREGFRIVWACMGPSIVKRPPLTRHLICRRIERGILGTRPQTILPENTPACSNCTHLPSERPLQGNYFVGRVCAGRSTNLLGRPQTSSLLPDAKFSLPTITFAVLPASCLYVLCITMHTATHAVKATGGSLFSTDFLQTNAMSGALNRSFYIVISLDPVNDGI